MNCDKKCHERYEYINQQLIEACIGREGNIKIVQVLLSIDINPNFQGEYGDTALIKASQYGHSEIVRLLLKNKANVNLQDEDGYTALIQASIRGHLDVVNRLLDHKEIDVNLQDNDRCAALMAD